MGNSDEPTSDDANGDHALADHVTEASAGVVAGREGATAIGANGVGVGRDNYGRINTGTEINIGSLILAAPRKPMEPPFQAPLPAPDHVPRSRELTGLKARLLDANANLLAVTIGVFGFGGAGKTALARLFCADVAVRRACEHGILWVPLGKNPPDPRDQIADLLSALTGDSSGCATLSGARARLQAALQGQKILLVIDDVWDEAQARDLIEASTGCARLVTTRNQSTLPFGVSEFPVGVMGDDDAVRLLGGGLATDQTTRLGNLARKLGHWPVLLRLANRALLQRTRQRTSLSKALDAVEAALDQKGVVAFDANAKNASERDNAVAATVEASLGLLSETERQHFLELAIFPEDVPIPLDEVAKLWQLSGKLTRSEAESLVSERLDPWSLLEYSGDSRTLMLHDVLRRYATTQLRDPAALHLLLCRSFGDRPAASAGYAWRWLAFHRARAALTSDSARRHELVEQLVGLVSDASWQQVHERALADLPALRRAIAYGLEAAVADDTPLGVPLLLKAADAAVTFQRDHSSPQPLFDLALSGDLAGARRRSELFSIDEHWRQALLLAAAWLVPSSKRAEARLLVEQLQRELEPHRPLKHLLEWVRAEICGDPAPVHHVPVEPHRVDAQVIEELLKRVGGSQYERGLLSTLGLDPHAQNPDTPPARGLYQSHIAATDHDQERATTRYLAEVDGPYFITYAALKPTEGTDALCRYISIYTNYSYPEYRFSTLWLLLGFVVQFPRHDGGDWVRSMVVAILQSALGGGSVEFEQGLGVAVRALKAHAEGSGARPELVAEAHRLVAEVAPLQSGPHQERSDTWATHKRQMFAVAQALGWLHREKALAHQVLREALALADSGFAGYQTLACLALAESLDVCLRGDPALDEEIERALNEAQMAAHNVQDPSFCARMTARVNAMRKLWWRSFDCEERLDLLLRSRGQASECAALHVVGQTYAGRRPDALRLPDWSLSDRSFEGLSQLHQRPTATIERLNTGVESPFAQGSEIFVPDPGFVPHLAARLAAELLAEVGEETITPQRLASLRQLVPYALPSDTALDAVLARLVLAQGRRGTPIDAAECAAFEDIWQRGHERGQLKARSNHSRGYRRYTPVSCASTKRQRTSHEQIPHISGFILRTR